MDYLIRLLPALILGLVVAIALNHIHGQFNEALNSALSKHAPMMEGK